ncbi:MAG: helix-turn-helix domain-containing protein [Myxococcota bacterium]|nr:helix-turn-helix domain-containing protein [Myxococcota bacterium]
MLEGEESFGELCGRFGISRKQGYKWKERFDALPASVASFPSTLA